MYFFFLSSQLKGPKAKAPSYLLSTPSTQILVSKNHSLLKGLRELGLAVPESKEVLKKWWRHIKKT